MAEAKAVGRGFESHRARMRVLPTTLALAIGAVLFVLVLWKLEPSRLLVIFGALPWVWLVLYLLLSGLFVALLGVRLGVLVGRALSPSHAFLDRLASFTVAYLSPIRLVGAGTTLALLLRRKGLKAEHSILLDVFLELAIDSVLVLAAFVVLLGLGLALPGRAELIFFVILLAIAGWMVFFFSMTLRKMPAITAALAGLGLIRLSAIAALLPWLTKIEKRIVRIDRKRLAIAAVLAIGGWIALLAEHWSLLWALGYSPTASQLYLITSFTVLATIVPIPASLGSLELGQAAIFSALGMGAFGGLVLALLIRGRDIIKALLGLVLLWWHGTDFMQAWLARRL